MRGICVTYIQKNSAVLNVLYISTKYTVYNNYSSDC